MTDMAEREGREVLGSLGLVASAGQSELGDLASLATITLDAPIATIGFAGPQRIWFKAVIGIEASSARRDDAFCNYTIEADELVVIEDARADLRFRAIPLVTGPVGIRFYAGAPIHDRRGRAVGSLCVMGRSARRLGGRQLSALALLARQAEHIVRIRELEREKVRLADHRYRAIVDSLEVGVRVQDLADRVLYSNPAADRILDHGSLAPWGWRPGMGPMVGDNGSPIGSGESPAEMARRQGSRAGPMVLGVPSESGAPSWLSVVGMPLHDPVTGALREVVSTFVDVTDHKLTEDRLIAAEARVSRLLDNLDVVVFVLDSASRFTYLNPAWETMTGMPVPTAMGRAFTELIAPDHVAEIRAVNEALLRGERLECRQIVPFRHLSGARRYLELCLRRAPDGHRTATAWAERGQVVVTWGTLTDVTADVLAERERDDALRQEREANEQSAYLNLQQDRLLQAVSHDMGAPLAAARVLAEILDRRDLPTATRVDATKRLLVNMRRCEAMVVDLLSLHRRGPNAAPYPSCEVSLDDVIRTVLGDIDVDGRTLEVDLHPLRAVIAPVPVERIVDNLLSNAVRHTPIDARIWVTLSRDGDGMLITVADDGPGVPDELRETVFDAYQRGRAGMEVPGVGVGLYLVSTFATEQGGRAWVEPRPGGGAAFKVWLPARPSDASEPANGPARPQLG